MATSEAQQRATKKYIKKSYDRISFTVPKGEREKIKSAAMTAGMSMNAYIVGAIREKMGVSS